MVDSPALKTDSSTGSPFLQGHQGSPGENSPLHGNPARVRDIVDISRIDAVDIPRHHTEWSFCFLQNRAGNSFSYGSFQELSPQNAFLRIREDVFRHASLNAEHLEGPDIEHSTRRQGTSSP